MSSMRPRTPERLADLISAIQVMGTYRFAVRRVSRWQKRLQRTPLSADSWRAVFEQHPELFTLVREKDGALPLDCGVALVWRRSKERNYDTIRRCELEQSEAKALDESELEIDAERLSRLPLATEEVSLLLNLALNLHERELKHRQEQRWWIAAVLGIAGVLVSLLTR